MSEADWISDRLRSGWPDRWPDRQPQAICDDVVRRIEHALDAWSLVPVARVDGGWMSVVLRVHDAAGASLILKVAPPHPDMAHEAPFAAHVPCAIAPIAVADAGMTLLLPAADPGTPLSASPPAVAARVCGRLTATVAQAGPVPGVATFEERVLSGLRACLDAAAPLVDDPGAFDVGAEAIADIAAAPRVLCHSDLHAGNVLRHRRTWSIIDGRGLVGPRVFDVHELINQLVERRQLTPADDVPVAAWARAAGLPEAMVWRGLVARSAWTAASTVTSSAESRYYANSLLVLARLADARSRARDL